ncbi:MAG: hypothetical protein WCO48_00425 [Candidatus Taylorbacteria bacterium]
MYSYALKKRAIGYRKKGFAYGYISQKLNVSKSTLSCWLRNVDFLPNETTKQSILKGQKMGVVGKRVDKIRSLIEADRYAEGMIGKLSHRDLFLLGVGIYIGEGSKTHNILRIVNADPRIIRFSIIWLNKCFNVPNTNIRVRLHIYPDSDEDAALQFWVRQLKIPKSSFLPCYIDRRLNKKTKKAGILPFGTAHLGVKSYGDKELGVLLHRKILATIDRVLEK